MGPALAAIAVWRLFPRARSRFASLPGSSWKCSAVCFLARPLGRVRGYLLLALLWEIWHFTSHTKGTWHEVISRMEIIVPAIVVITFALGFLMERTGAALFATAVHEWIRPWVDPGGYFLRAGLAALPVWLGLAWTWPAKVPPRLRR